VNIDNIMIPAKQTTLDSGKVKKVKRRPAQNKKPGKADCSGELSQLETGIQSGKHLSDLDVFSVVMSTKGLEKDKYDYRIIGYKTDSDGSVYAGYSDRREKQGNYISAVSPGGMVKWEARAGEDGLVGLQVGSDGSVYAKSRKQLIVFNGDGTEKFRHDFETKVRDDFLVDSEDRSYFLESSGQERKLYIIEKDGKRSELSSEIEELKPADMKMTPDGKLWLRESNRFIKLEPENLTEKQVFEITEPLKNSENSKIRTFIPSNDGGLFVQNDFNIVDAKCMEGSGALESFCDTHVFKLDSSGEVQWDSGDYGSKPVYAVNSRDELLISTNRKEGREKYVVIDKINEFGIKETFAVFSDYIREFMVHPENGHLFVQGEQKHEIAEFDSGGNLVNTHKLDDGGKLRIAGFAGDGRLFITDDRKKELFTWDSSDFSLVKITDHSEDYSIKSKVEQVIKKKKTSPDGSPQKTDNDKEEKKVIVSDDNVTIGGISIKKWGKNLKTADD
jgi:outer membrane protein assembly factor BamB